MKQLNSLIIISLILSACTQVKTGISDIDVLISRAERNIYLSRSIDAKERKKMLMDQARDYLDDAQSQSAKKQRKGYRVAASFALYYSALGNVSRAKEYLAIARRETADDPDLTVIETRMMLQEKGSAAAAEAIRRLSEVVANHRTHAEAHLTLGDSYFMLSRFPQAIEQYREVIKYSRDLQVLAADRLEYIDEIQSTRAGTGKFIERLF